MAESDRGSPKNVNFQQYFQVLPDMWKYLFVLTFFEKILDIDGLFCLVSLKILVNLQQESKAIC